MEFLSGYMVCAERATNVLIDDNLLPVIKGVDYNQSAFGIVIIDNENSPNLVLKLGRSGRATKWHNLTPVKFTIRDRGKACPIVATL